MIEIKELSLHLGNFSLIDINLTIGDGEYYVILGPTGAGKTVLLEYIAGLHRIKQGQILVDRNDVTHLTPEERNIGYVPQDYVLFPFLNVAENIAFGLRQRNFNRKEIPDRVTNLANLLGISHLLNRNTRSLSGGEKQRVAIARALAPSPRILILDEPLSALDLQTSKYLRLELRRIHKEFGVTTLHVTHNQLEAEEMADKVAILNLGKLEQVGSPHEVFFYPKNEIVSDFIGALNILECDTCRTIGQGLIEVNCNGLCIVLPRDVDSVKRIALFPRDIYVSDEEPPGPRMNQFEGVITDIKYAGAIVRLDLRVGENVLQSEVPHDIFERMALTVGKRVFLKLKLRRIRIFEGNNS
jgi:ABC-type sugar transport system ATPase subunit